MQEVYSYIYVSMYICKVLCARGGNTSNLMPHLKDHHPESYTEVISQQKSSRDGIIGTKKNVTAKSAEASGTPKQPTIIDIVEIFKKYNFNSLKH